MFLIYMGVCFAMLLLLVGVLIWSAKAKKDVPMSFVVVIMIICMGFFLAGTLSSRNSAQELINEMLAEEDAAWNSFASRGQAEKFVHDNYRRCINTVNVAAVGTSRNPPSLCASTTVSLAGAMGNREFAVAVNGAILEWQDRKRDKNLQKKLDDFMGVKSES